MDDRNASAHPNGNIFYGIQAALDIKITEILRVVAAIQTHSQPEIEHCYREFLLRNHDRDERGPVLLGRERRFVPDGKRCKGGQCAACRRGFQSDRMPETAHCTPPSSARP
ncbi:hypothetical protein [Immundisolibacter sp.]